MKNLIVVEQTATGYSDCSPDLYGCADIGTTRVEVEKDMRDANECHLEGIRADGQEVPSPHCHASYVEVVVTMPSSTRSLLKTRAIDAAIEAARNRFWFTKLIAMFRYGCHSLPERLPGSDRIALLNH